jgi:hypothetical protein
VAPERDACPREGDTCDGEDRSERGRGASPEREAYGAVTRRVRACPSISSAARVDLGMPYGLSFFVPEILAYPSDAFWDRMQPWSWLRNIRSANISRLGWPTFSISTTLPILMRLLVALG